MIYKNLKILKNIFFKTPKSFSVLSLTVISSLLTLIGIPLLLPAINILTKKESFYNEKLFIFYKKIFESLGIELTFNNAILFALLLIFLGHIVTLIVELFSQRIQIKLIHQYTINFLEGYYKSNWTYMNDEKSGNLHSGVSRESSIVSETHLDTLRLISTLFYLSTYILTSFIIFPKFASAEKTIQHIGSLKLLIPKDIKVTIFANDTPLERHMAFDDQGILFLSQTVKGKVIALPDLDKNGEADKKVSIISDRRAPHGLAFAKIKDIYYLYIAEETKVVRLKRIRKPLTYGVPETIIDNIPRDGHYTRTIKIKNNKLYLSVGSKCDACIERNSLRAAISRFNLDGSDGEIFAKGLRNSVGIEFSPYSGELWGVNNGNDILGDHHPKEELNIIKQGKHYGWPYCYESQVFDQEFGKSFDCSKTEAPAYTFTAHMAPLGLAFYQKGALSKRYNHSVFIAFHGSSNRSTPAGYKVIRLKLDSMGNIVSHEDFISGWLKKNGSPSGRPVDIECSPEGELYLSDDFLGAIYRISGN